MEYWRFKRQCLCADEVGYSYFLADVLVLKQNGLVHEFEIKCSKSDLCNKELKKTKHHTWFNNFPHYFSFCVPEELLEDTKILIETLNPKYGILIIDKFNSIVCIKKAKQLHNNIKDNELWVKKITYRNNSALIGYMKRIHLNKV
jgi:hypothetical protein